MTLRVFCVLIVVGIVVCDNNGVNTKEQNAALILKGRDISDLPIKELPQTPRDLPKFVLTEGTPTVEGYLNDGKFVPKYLETCVPKTATETAFMVTVQEHYNNLLDCVQRIRVYEERESPEEMKQRLAAGGKGSSQKSLGNAPEGSDVASTASKDATASKADKCPSEQGNKDAIRRFKDDPRDDILATCEGGHRLNIHTRYRYAYADAIYFYGAHRTIVKIRHRDLGFLCLEWSYTVGNRRVKTLTKFQCWVMIERIFAWQGLKNFFRTLINQPIGTMSRLLSSKQ